MKKIIIIAIFNVSIIYAGFWSKVEQGVRYIVRYSKPIPLPLGSYQKGCINCKASQAYNNMYTLSCDSCPVVIGVIQKRSVKPSITYKNATATFHYDQDGQLQEDSTFKNIFVRMTATTPSSFGKSK